MRVEQAEDVVVGLNEEGRGLRERCVFRQNPRIDVAVRRDDGQAARFFVQRARDSANRGIRIEEPILREDEPVSGLDDGRPARCVLPLPETHGLLVAENVAVRGIDAERATRPLGNVA